MEQVDWLLLRLIPSSIIVKHLSLTLIKVLAKGPSLLFGKRLSVTSNKITGLEAL